MAMDMAVWQACNGCFQYSPSERDVLDVLNELQSLSDGVIVYRRCGICKHVEEACEENKFSIHHLAKLG